MGLPAGPSTLYNPSLSGDALVNRQTIRVTKQSEPSEVGPAGSQIHRYLSATSLGRIGKGHMRDPIAVNPDEP